MKKKYDLECDRNTYKVDNINEWVVHITSMILARKAVQKNRPNHCISKVVSCAGQCVAGVKMNWLLFLLNEIMEDAVLV